MGSAAEMSRQKLEGDRVAHLAAWEAGLTFYDSPRICPKCKTGRRYVKTTACVECARRRAEAAREMRANPLPWDRAATRQEAIDKQQTYYYPRRRCRRGHVAKRSVATNSCYDCAHPRRS